MFDIREYCDRINVDKPDIFQLSKDNRLISADCKNVEKLQDDDLNVYKNEVKFYFDSYKVTWKDILHKYQQYKNPNLVYGWKDLVSRIDAPLYIFPTFMKSGK